MNTNNVKKVLLCWLLIAMCWNCTHRSETKKYQHKRDKIVNVKDKVKEIEIEDVFVGSIARLFLIDNYLIIMDPKSDNNLLHIFDKKTFEYVTSTAPRGQGPEEIANIGHIGIDETNRRFFVSDHGKQKIFSYELDSVLSNPSYTPVVKTTMKERQFPSEYQYINDTLCIARIIEPTGNYGYNESLAKWNMKTGEIKPMKYTHPKIEKKRVVFAVSMENGTYVECYSYHDLMTICDLDGNLKYNIYGPNWDSQTSNRIHHYGDVVFCDEKIVAAYSGGDNSSKDYYPTTLLIFDINGNYLKTLDIGYRISNLCYDKENNRIIMNLEDMIQFAYLDLNGLI